MLVIGIYLIIMIAIMYVAYKRLNSFNRKSIKILITVVLFILTFIMQVLLIGYGIINDDTLYQLGKGAIVLVLIIPIMIMIAEAILMPLYAYLINKYNKEKISRKRFIIYIMIILFLNNASILWFYVW